MPTKACLAVFVALVCSAASVSHCRGDMNNNGITDTGEDINLWVQALTDPAGYAEARPGLSGSRVWHGDCDCNGVFDLFDLNPFVARMGGCTSDCADDEPPAGPPGDTAALLRMSVQPERFPWLVELAGRLADQAPRASVRAYWRAVHYRLTH